MRSRKAGEPSSRTGTSMAGNALCHLLRVGHAAEQRYSHLDKECLGLMFEVERFHQYLWGRKFEVVTDHKLLLGLLGSDETAPVQASHKVVVSPVSASSLLMHITDVATWQRHADHVRPRFGTSPAPSTTTSEFQPAGVLAATPVASSGAPPNSETVLNTSSESPEGASIVLLTDGVENEQPYIHDIWPQLLAAKVEVVTMTMGDKSEEELEKLATETKGQSYFFPDRLENLSRAYIEANSSAHELTHHRLIMYITKGFNGTVQETFILDEGLGNNTVVTIIRQSAGNYSLMAWLLDPTGKRYPDILANDGWYTGYFTQFTGKGRYAVKAYVYGDNKTSHAYRKPGFPPDISISKAGVALPLIGPTLHAPGNYTFVDTLLGKKTPTVPFERVAYCGYLNVRADMRQTDVPPGLMRDLNNFDGYVESDRTAVVILTWTWPGAHMTHGKAAKVEIRGSNNKTNLEKDFDSQQLMSNVVKGNLDPLPAGSKHNVSIALPREWETTTPGNRDFTLHGYVAARVINADGLKGKLSRSLELSFRVVNFTAESLTTGAPITTRAMRQTKPGPARTTRVPEKPYTKTIQATTSTPPTKGEPARDPSETTTPEAGHGRKNGHPSIIIWILLALVAGVVVAAITIILLLRAQCSAIAENQATTTSTATMTTM
nr:uncharacterized protein LOC129383929 [Dermacentor andersoni]